MTTVSEIFGILKGVWTLERNIPGEGIFTGLCIFTPSGDRQFLYEEQGILSLSSGGTLETNRRYLYQLEENCILILYNDPFRKNEIMHKLVFLENTARHVHLCGEDAYDLTFHFSNIDRIKMEYAISGPKKNYRIESSLSRFAS